VRTKISSWSWVNKDVNALKEAIYENPVPVGLYLYQDFYNYTGGVYEHVTGIRVGGHAVLAVGWDDNPPDAPGKGCFKVKNSWGTGWGESGYFRIAYTQVTNVVNFGIDSADFEMGAGSLAPPMTSSYETATTVWGKIKNSR
jgi:C1A family cysteine protease